jgi:hypothetical protein
MEALVRHLKLLPLPQKWSIQDEKYFRKYRRTQLRAKLLTERRDNSVPSAVAISVLTRVRLGDEPLRPALLSGKAHREVRMHCDEEDRRREELADFFGGGEMMNRDSVAALASLLCGLVLLPSHSRRHFKSAPSRL